MCFMDRHGTVGVVGTITAATLSTGLDIYTKAAGAIAATFTVIYMFRRARRERLKSTRCEKCKNEN